MSDSPTPDLSLREKAERAVRMPWTVEAIETCSPAAFLALLSRVERAEADVRRMDWITEGNHSVMCYGVGRWMLDVPAESPRAAIDLAMSDDPTTEAPNAL